jgi:hypothetical protein
MQGVSFFGRDMNGERESLFTSVHASQGGDRPGWHVVREGARAGARGSGGRGPMSLDLVLTDVARSSRPHERYEPDMLVVWEKTSRECSRRTRGSRARS